MGLKITPEQVREFIRALASYCRGNYVREIPTVNVPECLTLFTIDGQWTMEEMQAAIEAALEKTPA